MFTIHPHYSGLRYPGQIPRLDPELDRTLTEAPRFTIGAQRDRATVRGEPARPIMRASAVAGELGLPAHASSALATTVKALSSSPHELEFRRSLMTHLLEQRYDAPLRRAIMERAVSFFRSTRESTTSPVPTFTLRDSGLPNVAKSDDEPSDAVAASSLERGQARGGKYHRRVPIKKRGKTVGYKYVYDEHSYRKLPDAHLDGRAAHHEYVSGAVRRLLDSFGEEGCSLEDLRGLVTKHGSMTIAAALRDLDARHENGRIRITKSALTPARDVRFVIPIGERQLQKGLQKGDGTNAEALPSSSSGGSFGPKGGGMPSPKKLPPGTRRIWHNRIVERGADDKWHVVGHVAGLEDPGKVPLLDPSEIDDAHRKELIAKIKELLSHEKKKHTLIHAPIPGPKEEPKPEVTAPKTSPKASTKTEAPKESSKAKVEKSLIVRERLSIRTQP